jgi:signal transduction histidine kinase
VQVSAAIELPDDGAGHPAPCPDDGERVGTLIVSDAAVGPEERVQDVAERFFHNPELEAVAVVLDRRPVGLLTRARLLLKLARGFGHELYARKPVSRIADASPLVVGADASIAEAISLALGRDLASVYEEVVVVGDEGEYLGLLPVRDLVLQQSVAYARRTAAHDAALQRTRDLERLEHLRSQFLAHATHELRSPVNAIAALADVLRRAGERGDLEAMKARLALLVQCTAGLRTTINNLLDLSRLEAGKVDLTVSRFAAADLLEEVATTTRLLSSAKPIQVRVEAGERARLETDQQKLRQVLVNLASNAAKFTERGEIVLSADRTPAGIRLAVRDTGCGISPDDLGRLFVPFGQLEDALVKAHEGTGLGLVIARSLVTLLGGRIEVASTPGQGSTFAIHLPQHFKQEAT